ncbi:MAG: response regulator [Gammaproteobacteria bacterium]|nr:response regulator [Gammaproteobacteria bacterium]MDH3411353.1 response regulator [Gammaproteobacteria bacterium]
MSDDATVYVVDDDEAIRHSLNLLIGAVGLNVRVFSDAASFIEAFDPALRGCIVADLSMPGMNGLEMQERLNQLDCRLPIIFLSGHGDVPAAVRALQKGAVDFLEKPFNPKLLLERIEQAVARDSDLSAAEEKKAEIASRIKKLTAREREIMTLVADGKSSKIIALDLGISERTVELHRFHIMKKMQARSVADLMRMLSDASN